MQSQVGLVGMVGRESFPDPVTGELSVAALAAGVGARDLMVLRRVAPRRFLQIAGAGRGVGWAGCTELTLEEEPALRTALAEDGMVRWDSGVTRRILGPYHARHAALVALDHDVAVLLGSDGPLAADDELYQAASTAVRLVEAVSPAKRLADELQLLNAVRMVMECGATDVRRTLTHVATCAAEALGCEVAVAWLPDQDELVVVERGWSLDASPDQLRSALAALSSAELPVCEQDSEASSLPAPLDSTHGVRSHYVLPFGAPTGGLLVLLHTVVAPRGFTDLCRTIGEKVAEAAGVVVQSAVLRAELESLVESAQALARRDALTGLANRLGWDEALEHCAEDVRTGGGCASVVVVDINGLKAVNDSYGHEAGDRFLQLGAEALTSVARRADTVARLGGDEFGLLLPDVDEAAAARVVDRVQAAVAEAGSIGEVVLSAAIGSGSCPPVGSVRSAWLRADAAMYEDKVARRASG